jgi:hypothetical protein
MTEAGFAWVHRTKSLAPMRKVGPSQHGLPGLVHMFEIRVAGPSALSLAEEVTVAPSL